METTPARAPFNEEDDYIPMRLPKSATTTPTHGTQVQMPEHNSYTLVASGGGSPSKLSPLAKTFVPRSVNVASVEPQQQQQAQLQNQQQYYQQPQQRQYANGHVQQNHHQQQNHYHHNQHQHQQQHQHQHQHQQQQQQQQQYQQQLQQSQPMLSLNKSIQERLKINAASNASNGSVQRHTPTGNYYQQNSRHNNIQQQQQQQQHHNQSQYNNHNSHNNHHHHHHQHHQQQQHNQRRYQQQQQQQQSSTSPGATADSNTVEKALQYLKTVIQCLNQNPGQYDTIATGFLAIFDGFENDEFLLSVAMEDIFQESIQNPNFRYMGAKLYNLLHMINQKPDSLFHTLLKCKLDYHQQEVCQFMQSQQQQKVRETALFLAELYMQLRGEDDTRIQLIAENIVYSLQQLLSDETADNIRSIGQTLKLAGYDLSTDCAEAMRDIIAKLHAIEAQAPGKYPLVAIVIALQRNNWGRKISSSNSLSDPEMIKPSEPLRLSDEPIFYGPDGRELTAEECEFLSGGAAHGMGGAGGGSTDEESVGDAEIDLDPEMDEEAERAYLEFCKMSST